ncbi:hypothetical protein F5Y00DRAFT_226202 [Daldinia vernicosa]|uniref:uncharacterized protein n=1 Tax=Daldinia vernicosa TaxID=114800 RepID=UPI0020085000|nr:uncharacterized protein F5Y00DRAFT_226202 [Daldinia vernicosa]KAI0852838.1 hypothetical protein F5Y00DRAFT_226202 [Daldinia vernicosa]
MAPARLIRPPTCLDCLRRLVHPSPASPPSFLSLQTRGAKSSTKAEEEDLQGIPVRLLQDIQGFGRKHAIIRVKPGRMRNYWFPKAQAEYMTRQRFKELGLTEAAIGVRDRSFGTKLIVESEGVPAEEGPKETRKSKKDTLTLPPEETLTLLETLLPPILTFARKPIPAVSAPLPSEPKPTPIPRSPSLAANAAASIDFAAEDSTPPSTEEAAPTAIFGSVSVNDILALIRERLLEDDPAQGGRVALEADNVQIQGLEGEDRIKRLGTFDVLITAGKDLEPLVRKVEVVPEE